METSILTGALNSLRENYQSETPTFEDTLQYDDMSLVDELETLTEEDLERIHTFFSEDLNLSQLSQQIIALLRMVISSGAFGKLKVREALDMEDIFPIVEQFIQSLTSEKSES